MLFAACELNTADMYGDWAAEDEEDNDDDDDEEVEDDEEDDDDDDEDADEGFAIELEEICSGL
jgi:hypothetical protein